MAMTPEQERILEAINSTEGGKNLSSAQKAVLMQAKLQGTGFEKFNPNDPSVPMPEYSNPDDKSVPMERDIPEKFLNIQPEGGLKPFMTEEQQMQERMRRMQESAPVPPPRGQPLMTEEQKMQERMRRMQENAPMGMKRGGYDPNKPLPDATIPPLKKSGGGPSSMDSKKK